MTPDLIVAATQNAASSPDQSITPDQLALVLVDAGNAAHTFFGYFALFVLLCVGGLCVSLLVVRCLAAIRASLGRSK